MMRKKPVYLVVLAVQGGFVPASATDDLHCMCRTRLQYRGKHVILMQVAVCESELKYIKSGLNDGVSF
jgi:hypothetical protein